MSNFINPSRHLSLFSPASFNNRRVDVIGAGATGSNVIFWLAKLGITNIHVWDNDKVVEENLSNQIFCGADIGKTKLDATEEITSIFSGTKIVKHHEFCDGRQCFGEVVFLLTDTMASRKEIWQGSIKLKPHTRLMIETRMDIDNFRIYVINPCRPSQIKEWEETLYGDEDVPVSACGASTSVGPVAAMLSGLAVFQFIRWWNVEQGQEGDELENEIIVGLRGDTNFITRRF